MRLAGRLTTKEFRSRCATCPERGMGSCMLAQALLGEDYRPDDCDGPKMQRSQPNILGAISNDLIE